MRVNEASLYFLDDLNIDYFVCSISNITGDVALNYIFILFCFSVNCSPFCHFASPLSRDMLFTVMSSHPAYMTNERSNLLKDNLTRYTAGSDCIVNKKKRHFEQDSQNSWNITEHRQDAVLSGNCLRGVYLFHL